MPVDYSLLCRDYGNKVGIIGQIGELVDEVEGKGVHGEVMHVLESKFQEYYLERHYGGLKCEVDNLSIRERLDQSQQ